MNGSHATCATWLHASILVAVASSCTNNCTCVAMASGSQEGPQHFSGWHYTEPFISPPIDETRQNVREHVICRVVLLNVGKLLFSAVVVQNFGYSYENVEVSNLKQKEN